MRFNIEKLIEKREKTADGVPFSSFDVIFDRVREVEVELPDGSKSHEYRQWKRPKSLSAILDGYVAVCCAKTRSGGECRARVAKRQDGTAAKRCRLHGGLSTGPTSEAGRARIAESNRRRAKNRVLDAKKKIVAKEL